MKPSSYRAGELGFDRSRVSLNAFRVIQRLQDAGYDGYLVGGCVRDLLIGRLPKDFDVATDACPEDIDALFDRSRIIGRRFRLVHVTFGRRHDREVIEVATYRAPPGKSSRRKSGGRPVRSRRGRILDDNVFGTIDADAVRRDVTINALYYDPVAEVVLDFVQGIDDAQKRTLRIIGNPEQRFKEDPVRMLRLVRFKAKLQLTIDPRSARKINQCAGLIDDVPGARLFDEIFKLFHQGAGVEAWKELNRTPLARRLFSQTLACLDHGEEGPRFGTLIEAALENTDSRVSSGLPVIPAFLLAVLLWWPFKKELKWPGKERMLPPGDVFDQAATRVFDRQSRSIAIPYRVRDSAMEIWRFQKWLEERKPQSIHRVVRHRWFRAAYDFLVLRQAVDEGSPEVVEWWTTIQDCNREQRQEMIRQLPGPVGRKKKGGKNRPPGTRFSPGKADHRKVR